jgi:S-adenosyl-L-methionine hydrolase (adenosine-forming)
MEPKPITLTTDFGHKDPFVGIMKGVILGINPSANVIDLTHGVPPQDLMAGAMVLRHAVGFFPRGTIHVAVVDPEVGTKRRPLLIEADDFFLLGPDNGLLSLALEGKQSLKGIELSNKIYHIQPTSTTFHGRDIFAPIAAYLSLGIPPDHFGHRVEDFARIPWPAVISTDQGILGKVVYVDGFGNLVTNVREEDLKAFNREHLTVCVGKIQVQGLAASYAGGLDRGIVALINSWGLLEISLYRGNAQSRLEVTTGEVVHIRENSYA